MTTKDQHDDRAREREDDPRPRRENQVANGFDPERDPVPDPEERV